MIYEVFLDGKPLYYPNDEEAIIYNSKLEEELNDSGTFECTVPKTNPLFDQIYPRVSMVQILRDGKEIFYGQVRTYEEEFEGEKEMTCVGELAFLYDSIQPQERYQNQTPQQFFNRLVNWHNSQVEAEKKFEPGIVTVTDPNNSIYRYTNYEDTLSDLRDKLCDSLDGYLRVRKADSKRYLDLVRQEDYGKYCDQPIKMGYNLLDYVKKDSGEAIYTVLIPLGARLDESEVEGLDAYTNIKSVNDGKDYICNEEAIKKFGLVWTTQKWDDVTVPENLLRKGKQWLETNQYESITLELTAIDMSMLNQNIDTFDLGDTIRVIAKPFGLDATYPVRKKTTYLQEPEKNTIVLSNTELSKSYTKKVQATLDDLQQSLPQEKTLLEMARNNATQLIKSATEGNIFFVNDDQGRPKEFLIMDQPDINTAQKVWRWNMNGLGYSNTGYNGEYGLAITMDGQIVGERVTAHSISAEQLTVEYKKTLSEEIKTAAGGAVDTANGYTDDQLENYYTTTTIDSKFGVTDGAITAEVDRATQAENSISGNFNASIEILSDQIESKVDSNGVESIITQKADSIRLKADKIAWSSTYSSMTENGKLTCQSAKLTDVTATGKMTTENGDRKVEMSNGRLHIYYNDQDLGLIGGNGFDKYPDKEGLNFDLEMTGDYMSWAAQETSGGLYNTKWTYVRDAFSSYRGDALNAGCDIDMHNYTLHNVKWPDGGINGTIKFSQVYGVASDGTAEHWSNDCMMQFKNGILVQGAWHNY